MTADEATQPARGKEVNLARVRVTVSDLTVDVDLAIGQRRPSDPSQAPRNRGSWPRPFMYLPK